MHLIFSMHELHDGSVEIQDENRDEAQFGCALYSTITTFQVCDDHSSKAKFLCLKTPSAKIYVYFAGRNLELLRHRIRSWRKAASY
jgi:hypothetical protein